MNNKMKVILFGGSFDPIHNGHLSVAQHALRMLDGQKLIFVPAGQSPHKKHPHTEGCHRLAMIQCAIKPFDNTFVSDCELQRSGPSYTLETIRHFKKELSAETDLYWLIGSDQLDELPKWYHIDELLSECHISTMVRAGYPPPDMSRFEGVFDTNSIARLRRDVVKTPPVYISSTEVRRQLSKGVVPVNDLPKCVILYIREHALYGIK